jgi:trigger factor
MKALEITSERNDENKIELTVTISADEVQKHIDAAYKEAGKVRIRGFRPGKAPRRVLENYYGGKEYFQAQATDALVKETFPRAIDSEGHVPLDKPEIEELDLVKEHDDYTYSMSFTVRPLFELSSYEPIQIELPSEEPTPTEIEEQVDTMLDYYVDFEEITDRPAQQGDFLILEMEVTSDGTRAEALSGDSIPYEMGSDGMPASFDEQLLGSVIDETREFDFDFSSEEAARIGMGESGSAHCAVTIKEIKARVKPDLTDAWVKEKIEFDSVEEFRTRIADSIRQQKRSELASLKERLISEELISRLQGEPTDMLVTQAEQGIYRDFFASLQRSNQTFDGFLASAGITPEAFREDIKKQAVELTAQTLALDAFARHLGLEASDEEIREEFSSSGAEDPEALYQQWADGGRLSEIREGLLRVKVARSLDEGAEIFEPGKKPAAKKQKSATKKTSAEKAPAEKAPTKKVSTEKKSAAKRSATKKDVDETADETADKAADKAEAKSADKAKSTAKKPREKKTATGVESASGETDNNS